ncbi:ABC transporter permease [Lactiplantibacillus modestisalitolerans]|uniref:ABC transporter permease n=1 Tax=Lactiplantibacillus modestisalitolerans TaxID=1457219 RepID=A0ABV5WW89_9LACO|nr:ABC transporter permease [Lactiplantibacillus modestisalitolerans]
MNTKLNVTTRYLLTDQLKTMGQSFLWLLAVFFGLPFIYRILTGFRFENYSIVSALNNLGLGIMFALFMFVFQSLTYDYFKLFIQNGISRTTYWLSRIYAIIIISFIGELLCALYSYGFSAPTRGMTTHQMLDQTAYMLYADWLGSNVWLNLLASMFFMWIFYIGCGLLGMAVGSLLALFNKHTQRILIMVIPILGVFALGMLISLTSPNTPKFMQSSGFENFLKFMIGYPLHGQALSGNFNPIMPIVSMIVGCGITGGLSLIFYKRLHLKN